MSGFFVAKVTTTTDKKHVVVELPPHIDGRPRPASFIRFAQDSDPESLQNHVKIKKGDGEVQWWKVASA